MAQDNQNKESLKRAKRRSPTCIGNAGSLRLGGGDDSQLPQSHSSTNVNALPGRSDQYETQAARQPNEPAHSNTRAFYKAPPRPVAEADTQAFQKYALVWSCISLHR
jgi:hypothetical protein